jgi:uncharacterized protein YbjT (DUF2867 family)
VRIILLRATGLVGSATLALALDNHEVSEVIAPTRTALTPRGKLTNPAGPRA